MTLTFSSLVNHSRHDSDDSPRWVHDKLKLRNFASRRGLPVPQLYKSWATPDEIDFSVAPRKFLIKANVLHGGKGTVPYFRISGSEYQDLRDNSICTPESIVDEQRNFYDGSDYKFSYSVMIEELILDSDGGLPSSEYEIYCFRNRTALIVQYRRTAQPGSETSVSFFNGEFEPLDPTLVIAPNTSLRHESPAPPENTSRILRIAAGLAGAINAPFLAVSIVDGSTGPVILGASPFPRSQSYGVDFNFNEDWDRRLGQKWSE